MLSHLFLFPAQDVMNFSYRIILPSKHEFGSKSDDGNWTGMVGQVFRKELDFGKSGN
jgi:hypothetical protein